MRKELNDTIHDTAHNAVKMAVEGTRPDGKAAYKWVAKHAPAMLERIEGLSNSVNFMHTSLGTQYDQVNRMVKAAEQDSLTLKSILNTILARSDTSAHNARIERLEAWAASVSAVDKEQGQKWPTEIFAEFDIYTLQWTTNISSHESGISDGLLCGIIIALSMA